MNAAAIADAEILSVILQCWGEVLGAAIVNEDRHFFLCGGDSLQMTRILVRVRQRLQVELRLQDLVEFSTPRKMAQWCRQRTSVAGSLPAALITDDQSTLVASQSQQGLWLSEQLAGNVGLYNSGLALHLRGGLDAPVLRRALALLAQQHPVLRSTLQFDVGRKQLLVRIAASTEEVALPLERASLPELTALIAAWVQMPFVFADSLLRYRLLCVTADHHVLLLCCHHCIVDGWSGGVLLQSLSAAYNALLIDHGWQPRMIDAAWPQHCWQEQQLLQSPDCEQRLQWWREHLRSFVIVSPPPWQGTAGQWPYQWQRQRCELPSAVLHGLMTVCEVTRTTLFSCLLIALRQALVTVGGKRNYCIGFPVANRRSVEEEHSIGCYMQMAFICMTAEGDDLLAMLPRVQADVLAAQQHALPLPVLIRQLQSRPLPDGNHWFDVVLALQNFPHTESQFSGITCEQTAIAAEWGQYPLKFEVSCSEGEYWLEVCYAEAVVSAALLAQLLDAFMHALQHLGAVRAE